MCQTTRSRHVTKVLLVLVPVLFFYVFTETETETETLFNVLELLLELLPFVTLVRVLYVPDDWFTHVRFDYLLR